MIKKVNIAILFSIIHLLAFSQYNYFNERFGYGLSSQIDVSRSLLEVENGYIIGGMSDLNYTGSFYLGFRKIDFEGNEVWTKTIGEAGKQYWIGEPGSLIKTSDGGYLMCGTYKDNSVLNDAALLVKFGESFDTLWTSKRSDTISPSNYLYYYFQCKEVINDGYVIIGVKKPYGEPSKMHLVKTDYNGVIIWEKVYGTGSYYYQGFSVIQTTDGGYAIGGYRFHIGQNETADPIIYKTDSLGNLEWEKNIGGPYFDYHPMLTIGNDGSIIAGTCYADSMLSPNWGLRRVNYIKFDIQGNEIWNKKFGIPQIGMQFHQIRTIEQEGNFIATGTIVNDFPHYSGWIMKVSNNGDSLWYRQYDKLLGDESRNYLYDVIPTSDNGFAACGYVIPYPPDPGSQDAWVLKVDSMGCDTPGCATGVKVFEFPESTKLILRVWPNPAKNRFSVFSSDFLLHNEKLVRVYNSQGIKVEEVEIPEAIEPITINIEGWPKGIYFVQLLIEGETLTTKKVIVH